MNLGDAKAEQIFQEVSGRLEIEKNRPLKVSVMGQTGVGKSSLINALFNTRLKTDPVRPCTKEIERVVVQGTAGYELWFYDLPGIGESSKVDMHYLRQYRQMLTESDIVLWAIQADNRSLLFDFDTLNTILEPFSPQVQGNLMSKITFTLTKADLLTPPAWILTKAGNESYFVMHPETRQLIEEKEKYCQEIFLEPFKDLMSARTYREDNFTLRESRLSYDEENVYYQGFLEKSTAAQLKERYPQHARVFDRLYDCYRIIPCSSHFKFNLTLLTRVIIDKIGELAIERFINFYHSRITMNIKYSQAKRYCNIMIVDDTKKKIIFDLANADL